MVRFIQILFAALILAGLSNTLTIAQVHGELFTKEQADAEFGPVIKSIEIPVNILNQVVTQTNDRLMFKIMDDQLIILDSNRNTLYPAGRIVNSQEVFSMFSISLIKDMLSQGSGASVFIEQRMEVLSITYGLMTLEIATPCPPICE